jgi:hypothetical protein
MNFKLTNEPDLDCELKKLWAHVISPVAQAWFRIAAKDYLLNLTGAQYRGVFRWNGRDRHSVRFNLADAAFSVADYRARVHLG